MGRERSELKVWRCPEQTSVLSSSSKLIIVCQVQMKLLVCFRKRKVRELRWLLKKLYETLEIMTV